MHEKHTVHSSGVCYAPHDRRFAYEAERPERKACLVYTHKIYKTSLTQLSPCVATRYKILIGSGTIACSGYIAVTTNSFPRAPPSSFQLLMPSLRQNAGFAYITGTSFTHPERLCSSRNGSQTQDGSDGFSVSSLTALAALADKGRCRLLSQRTYEWCQQFGSCLVSHHPSNTLCSCVCVIFSLFTFAHCAQWKMVHVF